MIQNFHLHFSLHNFSITVVIRNNVSRENAFTKIEITAIFIKIIELYDQSGGLQ